VWRTVDETTIVSIGSVTSQSDSESDEVNSATEIPHDYCSGKSMSMSMSVLPAGVLVCYGMLVC